MSLRALAQSSNPPWDSSTAAQSTASVPRPSLLQFAVTFAPFAVGLSAALLLPEAQTRIELYRAIYTIWLSSLFATAAYVLYILGAGRKRGDGALYQYWRLLWTFAGICYLAHFYYVFFGLHRADVRGVIQIQSAKVAVPNFIFTGWWAIDLAILWLRPRHSGWAFWQNRLFQVFAFIVFIVAFIFLRPGVPQCLGALMLVSAAIAFLCRFLR